MESRASDSAFQQQFRAVKTHNKMALARLIGERLNVKADPSALFDVYSIAAPPAKLRHVAMAQADAA